MHFLISIFLLLLCPGLTIAQNNYSGTVINKSTGLPVPYATIGLLKENTGINADEHGKFILNTRWLRSDTLIISSIGYETLKLACSGLSENTMIQLNKKMYEQEDIKVVVRKIIQTLNGFNSCGLHSYISSGHITQMAQHFRTAKKNGLLTSLEICKVVGTDKFRIRIYDMDSLTGKPGKDLTDSIIEITSARHFVNIGLKKYNIIIPGNEFFVAIEWLFIPMNTYKQKGKARKYSEFTYGPSIFVKKWIHDNTEVLPSTFYSLSYSGRWKSHHKEELRLLIAVMVKD